eukprot:4622694-Pleurochrysis_carterae.AAC.1
MPSSPNPCCARRSGLERLRLVRGKRRPDAPRVTSRSSSSPPSSSSRALSALSTSAPTGSRCECAFNDDRRTRPRLSMRCRLRVCGNAIVAKACPVDS